LKKKPAGRQEDEGNRGENCFRFNKMSEHQTLHRAEGDRKTNNNRRWMKLKRMRNALGNCFESGWERMNRGVHSLENTPKVGQSEKPTSHERKALVCKCKRGTARGDLRRVPWRHQKNRRNRQGRGYAQEGKREIFRQDLPAPKKKTEDSE